MNSVSFVVAGSPNWQLPGGNAYTSIDPTLLPRHKQLAMTATNFGTDLQPKFIGFEAWAIRERKQTNRKRRVRYGLWLSKTRDIRSTSCRDLKWIGC